MESFEYEAEWRLPGLESPAVKGKLTFDSTDGAILTFNINRPSYREGLKITDFPWPLVANLRDIDIILGTTDSGEYITLVNCQFFGLDPGVPPVTYQVKTVLVGCHIDKIEEVRFTSMSIRYSNLEEWLGVRGIHRHGQTQENNIPFVDIRATPPDELSFRIGGMMLTFWHRISAIPGSWFDYSIHQHSFVRIQPETPLHWKEYLNGPIYHLWNFLTLGMGTTVLPLEIKAKPSGDLSKEGASKHIDVYHRTHSADVSLRDRIYEHEMLFRYPDLADDFEVYLTNWFVKADKLRTVFDLYFSLFYIPHMYVHQIFLTLAQALEVYHRDMYGGQYMSKEEYQKPLKRLKAAIQELGLEKGHEAKIENMLDYGYEYSLKKRLKIIHHEVLRDYRPILRKAFPNMNELIEVLGDTRNYLTHFSKPGKAATKPQDQYELAQKARLLMELCFLHEMDIPADIAGRLVSDKLNRLIK